MLGKSCTLNLISGTISSIVVVCFLFNVLFIVGATSHILTVDCSIFQLPSQMSSVLNNSLLLHYINCVKDESILLRLYYWLSQALQEGKN